MTLTGYAAFEACIGKRIHATKIGEFDSAFLFDDGSKLTLGVLEDPRRGDVWIDFTFKEAPAESAYCGPSIPLTELGEVQSRQIVGYDETTKSATIAGSEL